jgi:hypothetical protein
MDPQVVALIKRCQSSPSFFIENFCMVKHPKAGIIPFKLFSYQKSSIKDFLSYRFNIYRKCRQSGISTIAGAFALWYTMFFPHKTVLIVSKRDTDAKAFLKKNVKLVYDNLPSLFRKIWGNPPPIYSEHVIEYPNKSHITSLTSSPDTMRSYSSSLNIIDEAAHMPFMEEMWSGAAPTISHGGNVIVISTSFGVGNWYHTTWEDAIAQRNDFHPIVVNWWEMDWVIEYEDELSGKKCRIAPRDGLRDCKTKEEIEKWGPYYSPWLEEQYRMLQERGESHLFRQEVLSEFLGSGNTVLTRDQLLYIQSTLDDNFSTVGQVDYIHPVRGEKLTLDFEHNLRVWKKPVRPQPDVIENGRIIKRGDPGHIYSLGIDISSSEANDYSSIFVLDCTTREQVAELNIKVFPMTLVMMADYIGRWYNGAFLVPERTGMGTPVSQSIYHDTAYSNVYRMKNENGKISRKVGYPTSPTYKPALVKCLLDYLGEEGVKIVSRRLFEQLSIFIHLGNKQTGNVKGPGNHDDLVISCALALVGFPEAMQADISSLIPKKNKMDDEETEPQLSKKDYNDILTSGGSGCLAPLILGSNNMPIMQSPEEEIRNFQAQMGGISMKSQFANPTMRKRNIILPYNRTTN